MTTTLQGEWQENIPPAKERKIKVSFLAEEGKNPDGDDLVMVS